MKNPQKILALVGGAQILAVMAGLPIDSNGFFLTAEQMEALDSAVEANEAVAAELLGVRAELTTAQTELTAVQAELATSAENLATANTALATAQTRITELEAMEGSASGTAREADEFEATEASDPMAFDFQQEILNRLKA